MSEIITRAKLALAYFVYLTGRWILGNTKKGGMG
jgi:hypothetical protein